MACQQAQRLAWGITDESYVVPLATLVGAQLHGGLVLGAFNDQGEALGVSFAFLGKLGGRICLYSQLTGVVPGQQGLGLGGRLKSAQRDYARAEGLSSLAWAFDPLQLGNAKFNLGRLGATCSRFVEDMYGPRTDALNLGTPTDRLIAEWSTADDLPPRPLPDPSGLPCLIVTDPTPALDPSVSLDGSPVLLEIPREIARLRLDQPDLARAWTLAVRSAFRAAFGRGYGTLGLVSQETEAGPRCDYVLSHRSSVK